MSGPDDTATETKPRHVHRLVIRRRTRILISIALGLIAGATLGAMYVYSLALRTPQWFRVADPETASAVNASQQRAIAFENAVLTEFSKVRPADASRQPDQAWRSERWAVSIDPHDLNNWLKYQGPLWAGHQLSARERPVWPPALLSLRLSAAADNTLHIGAVVKQNDGDTRFFALRAVPEIRADGLWLRTREVEIGEVTLGASWVLERARRAIHEMVPEEVRSLPDMDTLLDAASGTRPLISKPVIRLADGRKVLIVQMRCEQDRLILTCQTEAPTR